MQVCCHRTTLPHRVLMLSILAMIVSASTLMVPALGALAQPGSTHLTVSATNVYSLYALLLPSNLQGGITTAAVDANNSIIVLGGSGYVAAISVSNNTLLWDSSLEGTAVSSALDSKRGLVAIASDEGELLIYSVKEGGVIAKYYIGEDGKIVGTYLLDSVDGEKVAALTSKGYLRVYKVGSPFWAEIGPEPGEGPLHSIEGLKVVQAVPLLKILPDGVVMPTDRLAFTYDIIDRKLLSSINVTVYYWDGVVKRPAYAYANKPLPGEENLTANALLYIWITVYPYNATEDLSGVRYPVKANYTSTIKGLYPGYYRVHAFYKYWVIDTQTGAVTEERCYAASSEPLYLGLSSNLNVTLVANYTRSCEPSIVGGVFLPLAMLKAEGLPGLFNSSSIRFQLIKALGRSGYDLYGILEASRKTPSDMAVSGVDLIAVLAYPGGGSVYLDYLGADGLPRGISGRYGEVLTFEAKPTVLLFSPDFSALYVGTSSGTLYRLVWLGSEHRFVEANSMVVSGDDPVKVILESSGAVIAVSAGGLAQAVNVSTWKPLWRGQPGYPYLQLPLGGSSVLGAWSSRQVPLIVVPELPSGDTPFMLVAEPGLWSTPSLHRVEFNVSISLERISGGTEKFRPGRGSRITVLANGTPVAEAPLEKGKAIVYLPEGSYSAVVNASGWGAAWYNLIVGGGDENISLQLRFREVQVKTYTPAEGGIGYQLVAGPVAGASVSLEPLEVAENLTYTPLAEPLQGTTNSEGVAKFIVWDGLSYKVNAYKKDYLSGTGILQAWGPSNVSIRLYPVLYNVTIQVMDSDALESGIKYLISDSNLTITLNGHSISLEAPNGTLSVLLPKGDYTVKAVAPGYRPAEVKLSVPAESVKEIVLHPETYTVTFIVATLDNETGLASGPLASAKLNITLVDPPLPGHSIVAYTDSNGVARVSLRTGTYLVVVEHPYVETCACKFTVKEGAEVVQLTMQPRYSNVSFTLYDSELYNEGVLVANATITLLYNAGPYQHSLQVSVINGTAELRLPYGPYEIYIAAPGYEPYGPLRVSLVKPCSSIRIYLSPVKYEVKVRVIARDPLYEVAQGPVAGAVVEAIPLNSSRHLPVVTGYTGSDGTAVLLLRMGVYEIRVIHPYIESYSRYVAVGAPLYITCTVKPNYTPVTIKVVDADTGKPIPGAEVNLHYTGIGKGLITLNASKGSLEVLLPPGSYVAYVSREGYYYSAQEGFTVESGRASSIVVKLRPILIQVSLEVISARVSATPPLPQIPISTALVRIEPSDTVLEAVGVKPLEAYTTSSGLVTLLLRAGSYRYEVIKPGFEEASGTIHVKPGGASKIKVTLSPHLYNLTLLLIDRDLEEPYAYKINATLTIEAWNGYSVGASLPVSSGEKLLLPPGAYNITVSSPGYLTKHAYINVTGSGTLRVELKAKLYPIRLVILSSYGNITGPAQGVHVIAVALPPLKYFNVSGRTSAEGVVFLNLRRGSYLVMVNDDLGGRVIVAPNLTVVGPASLKYVIKPPLANLTFKAVDAEARMTVKSFRARITYNGPYGRGSVSLEASNGMIRAMLPYGSYLIEISATAYIPNTTKLVVGAPREFVVVNLRPIHVPFRVSIVDPDGNPIDGALVELHYEIPRLSPPPLVAVNGTAEVRGGVREGRYTILVRPPAGSPYEPVVINATVSLAGYRSTIVLPYKRFNVTILLKDSITGKLVLFPYKLELHRRGKAKPPLVVYPQTILVRGGNVSVSLPYGVYDVKLKPVSKNYYEIPENIVISVRNKTSFTINMKPKFYTVVITVVNDRSEPVAGALVELVDTRTHATVASVFTGTEGTASFKVIYGVYKVVVSHPSYKSVESYIMVPQQASIALTVYPTPLTVIKRMTPLLVGVGGLLALIAVLWRLKEVIASRLTEQEEYF